MVPTAGASTALCYHTRRWFGSYSRAHGRWSARTAVWLAPLDSRHGIGQASYRGISRELRGQDPYLSRLRANFCMDRRRARVLCFARARQRTRTMPRLPRVPQIRSGSGCLRSFRWLVRRRARDVHRYVQQLWQRGAGTVPAQRRSSRLLFGLFCAGSCAKTRQLPLAGASGSSCSRTHGRSARRPRPPLFPVKTFLVTLLHAPRCCSD